jgi:hypothetical protein
VAGQRPAPPGGEPLEQRQSDASAAIGAVIATLPGIGGGGTVADPGLNTQAGFRFCRIM